MAIAGDITQQHRLKTILLDHKEEDNETKTLVAAVVSSPRQRQVVRTKASVPYAG